MITKKVLISHTYLDFWKVKLEHKERKINSTSKIILQTFLQGTSHSNNRVTCSGSILYVEDFNFRQANQITRSLNFLLLWAVNRFENWKLQHGQAHTNNSHYWNYQHSSSNNGSLIPSASTIPSLIRERGCQTDCQIKILMPEPMVLVRNYSAQQMFVKQFSFKYANVFLKCDLESWMYHLNN